MANLYKIGALGTDDPSQIIQLQALFLGGTDRVCNLRLPFSTSAYQVTVGKTLYILKMIDQAIGVGNPAYYKIGYADNDVGFDTTTARTNPVMSVGIDDGNNNGIGTSPVDSGPGNSDRNESMVSSLIKFAVSQKFPFIRRVSTVAGNSVILWCVEL